MKKKLKILVSCICGNSYGAQIAKSLTLLHKNYELFGADSTLSDIVDTIKLIKLINIPKASATSYLDSLINYYHDNAIDYYIEGSEAEQRV